MNIFEIILIQPITNFLLAIYALLSAIHIPFALGFSIILLTVIIRLILWPFVTAQIKSTMAMQKLGPEMAKLKEKYKADKKKQQEEMMKLYKVHGVNPVGGCLPMLIQIPIFIGLYQVMQHVVVSSKEAVSKVNDMVYHPALKVSQTWDTSFFGIPLAAVPKQHFTSEPWYILAPLLTAGSQFLLSKMMAVDAPNVPKTQGDDFQRAMQRNMLYLVPVMMAYFSFILPLGLSLYWITFTLFGILQQYILAGPGAARPWFEKVGIKK